MNYIVSIILLAFTLSAYATGTGGHSHKHVNDHPFGHANSADQADKIIEIVMTDNKYNLETLTFKDGETVHFKIKNIGQQIHEFTIATQDMHIRHQAEMLKHISSGHMSMTDKGHGKDHSHDNSLLLNPGEHGELTWTFSHNDNIEYACNVPGHYESGMVGSITIN